jgi:hypothetical protein
MEMGSNNHGLFSRVTTNLIGYDTIWMIVDMLTKAVHFIPIKVKYSLEKLTKLYLQEIIRLCNALPKIQGRKWVNCYFFYITIATRHYHYILE